jgi:hypothetical protein
MSFIERLNRLSPESLLVILSNYEHGESIANTCENKQETIECLALAFEDELIDEIELLIEESGN